MIREIFTAFLNENPRGEMWEFAVVPALFMSGLANVIYLGRL
jgi:hypothetical protein